MNSYSHSHNSLSTYPPHYTQFIPFNFQYPDLGLLIEFESATEPSLSPSRWIYLISALMALGLTSFGFLTQSSQMQQASAEVQKAIYTNYLSLTH